MPTSPTAAHNDNADPGAIIARLLDLGFAGLGPLNTAALAAMLIGYTGVGSVPTSGGLRQRSLTRRQ
jgi:hypothetical protein